MGPWITTRVVNGYFGTLVNQNFFNFNWRKIALICNDIERNLDTALTQIKRHFLDETAKALGVNHNYVGNIDLHINNLNISKQKYVYNRTESVQCAQSKLLIHNRVINDFLLRICTYIYVHPYIYVSMRVKYVVFSLL